MTCEEGQARGHGDIPAQVQYLSQHVQSVKRAVSMENSRSLADVVGWPHAIIFSPFPNPCKVRIQEISECDTSSLVFKMLCLFRVSYVGLVFLFL